MEKFLDHKGKLFVVGVWLWALILLTTGSGFAQETIIVNSDEPSFTVDYPSGGLVDLRLRAKEGEKIWLLIHSPSMGMWFANPSSAYCEQHGAYIFPFFDEQSGQLAPNAAELYYTDLSEISTIDLGPQDFTGLGYFTIATKKGELAQPFGLDPIQTITFSEHPPFDPQIASQLQELLDTSIAQYRYPGGVMAVRLPDGAIWVGATGVSSIKDQTPMEPFKRLRIGSISKSFTGTVILQLAQEGAISLDDTLEKWLPGLVPSGENITIRQLLNHTSGINNYWHLGSTTYYEALDDLLKKWAPRELVRINNELGALSEPGVEFHYSNCGPILTSLVAQAATGTSIGTLITQRIIEPLDLRYTSFPGDETILAPFSHGYLDLNADGVLEDPGDEITIYDPSFAWSSGAVITNVMDLLRWATALVSGELLNEEYQKQRLTFFDVGTDLGSGLGIFDEYGAIGHKGDIFGFQATAQRYEGVDFAVIVNSQGIQGVFQEILEEEPTGNLAQLIFWRALPILGLSEPDRVVSSAAIRRGIPQIMRVPGMFNLNEY